MNLVPAPTPDLEAPPQPQAPTIVDRGDGRGARGLFAPGNKLSPGRPRGLDLKSLVQEEAEKTGFDLRAAWWKVVRTLFRLAEAGDVAAAKLLCDRLALPAEDMQGALSLVVITGVDERGQPAQGIALRVTPRTEGDA